MFIKKIILFPFLGFVYFYRYFVSPLTPCSCRFVPTCSEYAIDSLKNQGLVRGTKLTIIRLLKCQPFGKSGLDQPKEVLK